MIVRITQPGFPDCNDCFYLDGREKHLWLTDNGNIYYSIDYVIGTKPKGTIRVGLDMGGGTGPTGSFAARMREATSYHCYDVHELRRSFQVSTASLRHVV